MDARNSDGGLSARRVTIRYEVSGPVLAATADEIGVAGQRVVVTAQTLGLRPGIGDWVSVSGIRRKGRRHRGHAVGSPAARTGRGAWCAAA